jgi:hypothetical protein
MYSTRCSCHILLKLQYSRQIFEKYSNTKFPETPSNRSRVVPCGRTDGQTDTRDEAPMRFSQFCKRRKKWLSIYIPQNKNPRFSNASDIVFSLSCLQTLNPFTLFFSFIKWVERCFTPSYF